MSKQAGKTIWMMMMMMMMMMIMNCSCGMIGQQKVFSSLVLFPGETIIRDFHHHESLTRYQQGFNLCRT